MKSKSQKVDIGHVAPQPDTGKLDRPDRLFHEVNLLRWEGYYFCFDPRAAAKRKGAYEFTQLIKMPEGDVEHSLIVEPNDRYGYPSIIAYKVLQAITKKLTDYGYPVRETVSFSRRELAEMIGRSDLGGVDSRQLQQALMQLRRTVITGYFFNKDTEEWRVDDFQIVDRVIMSGKGVGKNDRLQACVVHLNSQIIESFNSRYAFCINYKRIEGLEPIAVALFKQVYFRFSYLHSHKTFGSRSLVKDYGKICCEWLGGLKVLRYKSDIKKDQLGRHLDQLKRVKLIRSYSIEKNKKGDSFNITFVAGTGFFEDYENFYKRALQPGLPFERATDEHHIQHPLELVRHFYTERHGSPDIDEFLISEKERALARDVLERYSLPEAKSLVDFALAKARETNFDVQTFGSVKLSMAAFEASRERRQREQKRKAEAFQKAEQERTKQAYDDFRKDELIRIRDEMPKDELEAIEATAKETATPGICSGALARIEANREIENRYPILSFEAWLEQTRN